MVVLIANLAAAGNIKKINADIIQGVPELWAK